MAVTTIPAPITSPTFQAITNYQDNVSVGGSTYINGSMDISQTGYTPIGIITIFFSNASSNGTRYTYVDCTSFELDGTTAYYRLYNRNANAAKIKITLRVLYRKDS